MKRFVGQVVRNVPFVQDVLCNKCGESCRPHADSRSYEHAAVSVKWGYESTKDGSVQSWDVCEKCHDEFVATFKLPPTLGSYMGPCENEAPFEETGFLPEIPLYPSVYPDSIQAALVAITKLSEQAFYRGEQSGLTRGFRNDRALTVDDLRVIENMLSAEASAVKDDEVRKRIFEVSDRVHTLRARREKEKVR